nr:MAG TPA: hypothetical protein [Caudoviricetes sp.]
MCIPRFSDILGLSKRIKSLNRIISSGQRISSYYRGMSILYLVIPNLSIVLFRFPEIF